MHSDEHGESLQVNKWLEAVPAGRAQIYDNDRNDTYMKELPVETMTELNCKRIQGFMFAKDKYGPFYSIDTQMALPPSKVEDKLVERNVPGSPWREKKNTLVQYIDALLWAPIRFGWSN